MQNVEMQKSTSFFDVLFEHIILFFFLVLGLELRAFTLSHSTSPIFVKGFSR
jgi:hypothetical protein